MPYTSRVIEDLNLTIFTFQRDFSKEEFIRVLHELGANGTVNVMYDLTHGAFNLFSLEDFAEIKAWTQRHSEWRRGGCTVVVSDNLATIVLLKYYAETAVLSPSWPITYLFAQSEAEGLLCLNRFIAATS